MQQRFTVNMWAGIVGDSLLGPCILPPRLHSHKYLVFLQEVLPELLTDIPAPIRRRMWFQQDGAPSHYASDGRSPGPKVTTAIFTSALPLLFTRNGIW
ncbi:uncharacterized protein TNCV_2253661 [Trichonephila clavipes]|nr:uncharacterized protein TNCV_2253661 [Trichonephila clavipes]